MQWLQRPGAEMVGVRVESVGRAGLGRWPRAGPARLPPTPPTPAGGSHAYHPRPRGRDGRGRAGRAGRLGRRPLGGRRRDDTARPCGSGPRSATECHGACGARAAPRRLSQAGRGNETRLLPVTPALRPTYPSSQPSAHAVPRTRPVCVQQELEGAPGGCAAARTRGRATSLSLPEVGVGTRRRRGKPRAKPSRGQAVAQRAAGLAAVPARRGPSADPRRGTGLVLPFFADAVAGAAVFAATRIESLGL